jgi:hypothetical protein
VTLRHLKETVISAVLTLIVLSLNNGHPAGSLRILSLREVKAIILSHLIINLIKLSNRIIKIPSKDMECLLKKNNRE